VRLNLGCGEFLLDGWLNVDAYPHAEDQEGYFLCANMLELEYRKEIDEINLDHSLEHISYHETLPFLARMFMWMKPLGTIRIEVPDMGEIMRHRTSNPLWATYIYGSQKNRFGNWDDGEIHRSGFTSETLAWLMNLTGWKEIEVREFFSEHPFRLMMPCLEAKAHA